MERAVSSATLWARRGTAVAGAPAVAVAGTALATGPGLPGDPGEARFLEVISLRAEEPKETFLQGREMCSSWFKPSSHERATLKALSDEAFKKEDAGLLYSSADKCFMVTKTIAQQKSVAAGTISCRRLSDDDKKLFDSSREKESSGLIAAGAQRVMTLEESRAIAKDHPEHIIDSLWVERWKPVDDGPDIPKSRWCAVGWQDPDIHEMERAAPTPTDLAAHTMMQAAASRRWSVRFPDVSQAFSQSDRSNRAQPLPCRQPRDGGFPGCQPGQLILLRTEVYGLVSGASWWRTTFVNHLVQNLGYVVNRYDRCVLTLPGEEEAGSVDGGRAMRGIILVEMGDIIDVGGEAHRQKMAQLAKKFKFGKDNILQQEPAAASFAGKKWRQLPDYSLTHCIDKYVQQRVRPVELEGSRRKPGPWRPDDQNLDSSTIQCRNALALPTELPPGVKWHQVRRLAVRQDLFGQNGPILAQFEDPQNMPLDKLRAPLSQPSDITLLYVVEKFEATGLERRLSEVETRKMRRATVAVAWAARQGYPLASALASMTQGRFPDPTVKDAQRLNKAIGRTKTIPLELKIWSIPEERLRGPALSDSSLDTSGRDRSQHGWLVGLTDATPAAGEEAPVSVLGWKSRNHRRRRGSSLLVEAVALTAAAGELERMRAFMHSVLTDAPRPRGALNPFSDSVLSLQDPRHFDPDNIAAVDAKSLYGTVCSEQTLQEDRRAALEIADFRGTAAKLRLRLRWVLHDRNPADCLTKMDGAHEPPAMQLLTSGRFSVVDEQP